MLHYTCRTQGKVVRQMSSKMGRPISSCRKDHDLKVRVDGDTHKRLLEYCKENEVTKAEAIRRGIGLILEKK